MMTDDYEYRVPNTEVIYRNRDELGTFVCTMAV